MASVEVRDADPTDALAFLTALEAGSGVPPVDEDERRRLAGLPPIRDRTWHWDAHLVDSDGAPVAYAGIRMPAPASSGAASGTDVGCAGRVDLAFDRSRPDAQQALAAVLGHVRLHAAGSDPSEPCGPLEAWLRGATDEDLATATGAGFHEVRRLHVLGVTADGLARDVAAPPSVPDGLRLRSFDPDAPGDGDAAAVVRLLTRAYPPVARAPSGGFDERFPVLRAADWFRAEDLLLLEDVGTGELQALHWMKRRGDGIGEVYNLAVDPSAQGRRHGALLLDAGLRHLVDVGSREVVLWVDAANAPAIALYRSRGFTERWDDVSLVG